MPKVGWIHKDRWYSVVEHSKRYYLVCYSLFSSKFQRKVKGLQRTDYLSISAFFLLSNLCGQVHLNTTPNLGCKDEIHRIQITIRKVHSAKKIGNLSRRDTHKQQ